MICIKLGFLKKTQGRKYCGFYKHHLREKKKWCETFCCELYFCKGTFCYPWFLGVVELSRLIDLNGLNSAEPPNSLILFLDRKFGHAYLAILQFSFRYYIPTCSLKRPRDAHLRYSISTYRLQLAALESPQRAPISPQPAPLQTTHQKCPIKA